MPTPATVEPRAPEDDRPIRERSPEPAPKLAPDLPYGRRTLQVIKPLHDAFGPINRWLAAPAIRSGLGPLLSNPLTGSLLLLRTTGRRSGLPREAPLGYVIRDGSIYCCAGFGHRTAWYLNLIAEPRVEVVLPTIAVAGLAETVTDPAEWDRVFPDYIRALGVIGRLTLGDVAEADAERRESIRSRLPLVRVRPTGLASGPADPGGGFWIVVEALVMALAIRSLVAIARRFRRPTGS